MLTRSRRKRFTRRKQKSDTIDVNSACRIQHLCQQRQHGWSIDSSWTMVAIGHSHGGRCRSSCKCCGSAECDLPDEAPPLTANASLSFVDDEDHNNERGVRGHTHMAKRDDDVITTAIKVIQSVIGGCRPPPRKVAAP